MEEEFELPVAYKGKDHLFKSTLLVTGYTYKIRVEIEDQMVLFEPDEERNYRAVVDQQATDKSNIHDIELLKEIAKVLKEDLK